MIRRGGVEMADLLVVEERQESEVAGHEMVLGPHQRLVQHVGAGALRIEPQRLPAGGLAHLRAVRLQHERGGGREHLGGAGAADEVDAGDDVAPLVAAADLQPAPVGVVEMQEVVGLQEHVAELREGDAVVGPLQAGLDGLLRHHLVHREVLADVAQEVDEADPAEPVGVVDEDRPCITR